MFYSRRPGTRPGSTFPSWLREIKALAEALVGVGIHQAVQFALVGDGQLEEPAGFLGRGID
jgi:hypothetical protein